MYENEVRELEVHPLALQVINSVLGPCEGDKSIDAALRKRRQPTLAQQITLESGGNIRPKLPLLHWIGPRPPRSDLRDMDGLILCRVSLS
jgi:hypothetical protein